MQKERENLKELLRKKEPEFEDLENSQPIHIAKKKKMKMLVLKRTPRVAEKPFDRVYGIR